MTLAKRMILLSAVVMLSAVPAVAKNVKTFVVNEYFGVRYQNEPVSCDVTFEKPVPLSSIALSEGEQLDDRPFQVEVLEGTTQAVRKARVWTLVSFRPNSWYLQAKEITDVAALVKSINADLAAEGPSLGKEAWDTIRKEMDWPRDHKKQLPAKLTSDQTDALRRGINHFIGRNKRYDKTLVEKLDLAKRAPEALKALGDKRPSSAALQEVNRAAVDAAWKGIAKHKIYPRQRVFHIHTGVETQQGPAAIETRDGGTSGGVKLVELDSGVFRCRVVDRSMTFKTPVSALKVPGPVVSVSRDGKQWIGDGYLDSMRRVEKIEVTRDDGPVYSQRRIVYHFEDDRSYKVRVRVYPGKPYAQLVEDFDVGGASKYVFNYGDWTVDGFYDMGDSRLYGWSHVKASNPCGDFVTIEGQKALARLVIWTQHNYFAGKQEIIGLKQPAPDALRSHYAEQREKYAADLAKYKRRVAEGWTDRRGRGPRKPDKPDQPAWSEDVYTHGGASMETGNVLTPAGDSLCVGGFYIRPDRWTRAKVNHVDLYLRPEVPGDRMTRGVVGLKGAKLRPAMEAWLVDGHREWAIFAVPAADRDWMAKSHVRDGVWPLDRLNRLTLVWNSDGSPVSPASAKPTLVDAGGAASAVLKGTRGRSGMQYFNGSNGHIRGGYPPREGWDGSVTPTRAKDADINRMISLAITAYMAGDDSAYPSFRAMLPWTHPEAINPFYQGMENMNFNADLYRYVSSRAYPLAKMGHPEADRFLTHAEKSLDMALNRYVYPQSGCWEESHGYAGHTLKVVGPLAQAMKNTKGRHDFLNDPRLARMMEFFLYVHTPIDRDFGNRVVPAVGDHGQSKKGPADRLGPMLGLFANSTDPEVKRIAAQAAWLIREDNGNVPDGITPSKPDMRSRWLQGYGSVLRGLGESTSVLEITLDRGAVRAGKKHKNKPREMTRTPMMLTVPLETSGKPVTILGGGAPRHNRGTISGTAKLAREGKDLVIELDLELGSDKWVKGGQGKYTVRLAGSDKKGYTGSAAGTFGGHATTGDASARVTDRSEESFLVLRAGQSWGHHHMDKGSMWFWGRGVHFFGDCSWGAPPGGTYGNPFKQGPASGTQIEMKGITNWTLPCKYAAPYIADETYADGYDYALARCQFPFNPKLELAKDAPSALWNGYDRQVLFVHPDVLIVRDNVQAVCETVWRLHSFQKDSTRVKGNTATLKSSHGVTGELAIVYPRGVKLDTLGEFPKVSPWGGQPHKDSGKPFSTLMLEWEMPTNTSATWAFAVHGKGEKAPKTEKLDENGYVTKVTLHDGSSIVALLNIDPFEYTVAGRTFKGTAGLVRTDAKGRTTFTAIRGTFTKGD